ncbi:hypothetical protein HYS50_01455 [Candidatus Woesearchaeota archaeon]|nr:hypothetical protein [Candidatus Woesearchaeota archaeon]
MQDGKYFISFRQLFFILVLVLLAMRLSFYQKEEQKTIIDAASVFDAAATTGLTNISATVIDSSPFITITNPENKTYENNESVELNISVANMSSLSIDQAFYNLDDTDNITLTLDSNNENRTFFGTAEGSHTLKVFANNTANELNSTSVDLFLNRSIRFHVNYSKYDALTTAFSTLNESDLETIQNMILEISSFGKIEFNEVINMTDDNITDENVDINPDYHINITSMLIFINETVFPNLEGKQASIAFYNVSFANPRVLRNGVACPVTICTSQTLANQILTVSISGFSQYEVEEGEGEGAGGGGGGGGVGGGGGGGGGVATTATYNLDEVDEQTNLLARIGKIFIIWKGEEYTARVGKPSPSIVLIDFTVLGAKLMLSVGQTSTLDLDNDGEVDIRIKVEDMKSNFLILTVSALRPRSEPSRDIKKQEEEPKPLPRSLITITKKALLNKDLLGIILLLIVAGIIVEVERRKKMKSHKGRALHNK